MIIRHVAFTAFLVALVSSFDLVIKPSRNFDKKTGDSFMIQCKVHDEERDLSQLNITKAPMWSFSKKDDSDKLFVASARKVKFMHGHTTQLLITNATLDDAGTYRCTAEVDAVLKSKDISVLLYKSIKLVDPQQVQHPTEGETARIFCKATAMPAPEINWFKKQKNTADDGEDTETVIDSNNERYSFEDNYQVLVIKQFDTLIDNGFYKCSVNQVESGDMKDLNITVEGYVRPQIKHVSEQSEFNEGSSGELSCAAVGVPVPHFRWYKEDAPLTAGDEYSFPDEGLLKILKTTPEDAGKYTCEAFNDVGTAKSNLTVKIFLSPKIVSILNSTAKKEESVSIPCAYYGDEPLTAKWLSKHGEVPVFTEQTAAEGENVKTEVEHNRYVSVDNDRKIITLHITKATVDDSGEYQCQISNKAGSITVPAIVKIEHKPVMLEHPPQYVRPADLSSTVELTCSVDALPLARWSWAGPQGSIDSGADFTVSNSEDQKKSTLRISQIAGNYGVYKCIAQNDHGTDEKITEVLKIELPPQPSVIPEGSFPIKARLVVNNYAAQGSEPIPEYLRPTKIELRYALSNDAARPDMKWEDVDLISEDYNSSGIYEIYKLRPDTKYTIAIKGVNEAGSSEVVYVEYQTALPEPPTAPAFITLNFTECLTASCPVQWSVPEDGGSSIAGYTVMYRTTKSPVEEQQPVASDGDFDQSKNEALSSPAVASSKDGEWMEGRVESNVQQIELKNLLPKTTYIVRVYAKNGIGESQPSPDLYIKTREFGIHEAMAGNVNAGAIVAIVIIVVLIFVLLVDVACYYVNQCGLLMCVCISCCGKTHPQVKAKEMDMEQGKIVTEDKKPLQEIEDAKADQGEDAPMIIKDKVPEIQKKDTSV